MEVQGAECNRLLADGWVLLGVYPLTTAEETEYGKSRREQSRKQPQAPSGTYGAWLGMWWERGENRKSSQLTLCLCLIIMMMTDTTYVECQNTLFGWFEGLVRML
jgi:hypothetical protein